MVRRLAHDRPERPASYPRPGEPILPRLLRPLLDDRHEPFFWAADGGAQEWSRTPPEICRRMGMAVVDRVQSRLAGFPQALRNVHLPSPVAALSYGLERRTANTIRRAIAAGGIDGQWTLGRYIALPRFGARAVVDLLCAVEAHGGHTRRPDELRSERRSRNALAHIARRLPISTAHARAELADVGDLTAPPDLSELARVAARSWLPPPFRLIELGGSRVAVNPSQVTAAKAAYRIATRAVQGWGAATIRAVAAQLRGMPGPEIDAELVVRLLPEISGFQWIDRRNGWFWFVGRPSSLLADALKLLAVSPRWPIRRFWRALFRPRPGPGPGPSLAALSCLCAAIPGARIVDGATVAVDPPPDRSSTLDTVEAAMVEALEGAPGGCPADRLKEIALRKDLSPGAVSRFIQRSPLVTTSARRLVLLAIEASPPDARPDQASAFAP